MFNESDYSIESTFEEFNQKGKNFESENKKFVNQDGNQTPTLASHKTQ